MTPLPLPTSVMIHKALDIEQKAKFGQKKLALNKLTNLFNELTFLLSWYGNDTNC